MSATHAVTTNGRIHSELKPASGSLRDQIQGRLQRLDAAERYSLGLWALPPGVAFDDVDLDAWPQEFLQAAGSADRMTVELRMIDAGLARQFVVGRAPLTDGAPADQEVFWDGFRETVRPAEVFTWAEAIDVFWTYCQSDEVGHPWVLREVSLEG
ncbi:hypothetical protein [Nostocoides sp. Soil756]|jgi:hypothetical protein|uniref:hypothetical protein n=1 Tax=Nostocoides sp. Soil756 TaxID=1736399 RepID=UPI0006FEC9BB|nr:hypothetical protein [Tetrasphaera sp. Soil756]KRE60089.1 hypothetical protein ASG78_15355 [Tetrasphaera sp. Soil756]